MPTEVVVEFSSNWGGDRHVLARMLDEAVCARVDRIKTQSFSTCHLSKDDPQFAWMAKSEMTDPDHEWIIKECRRKGMGYLTTPFHADRVPYLADLGLDAIKIGSGEASNAVMLEAIARYPWKVYLSTGLVTGHELDTCVNILGSHDLTLMHTVSEYPTPTRRVNMGRMSWLAARHGLPVGYSDHTAGLHAPLTAIARGAAVVEVHFAAQGTVPRRNSWDKDKEDLTTIVMFRDAVEQMMAPGRMLWESREARPHVGRWQH